MILHNPEALEALLVASDTVLLGPVVQTPPAFISHHLILARGKAGSSSFELIMVNLAPAQQKANETRDAILAQLITRRGTVIHDCDDELDMARWLETAFPSKRATRLRQNLQNEFAAR